MFKQKNMKKQNIKNEIILNETNFLDSRIYNFKTKIKKISKDEASVSLLAKQLSKLIKTNQF